MADPLGDHGVPSLAGRTVSILLARAAGGDRESCAALVERVNPLLLVYARRHLTPPLHSRFDPDDIVNDAWARILPKLGDIHPADGRLTKALLKYAAAVINNRLRDLARRHQGVAAGLPHSMSVSDAAGAVEPADAAPGIFTVVTRREIAERLYAVIDELPQRDREIILLRGIGQQSNEEVAAALGIRRGTVAVRYHRALDKLRRLLPMTAFDDLFVEDA